MEGKKKKEENLFPQTNESEKHVKTEFSLWE